MSSEKKTVHSVNVSNLATLINHCKAYDSDYQPFNLEITIFKLETIYNTCQDSVEHVNVLESSYIKATTIRKTAFKPLKRLTTRIINAFTLCGASREAIDNASTLARKVKCNREYKKDKSNANNLEQEINKIYLLQMSFDNCLSNFYRLIQALKIEPKYNPEDADLEVNTLEAKHADLIIKNNAVREVGKFLNAALLKRNQLLYAEKTGIVFLAANVKNYVSSIYGIGSPKLKQISRIPFRGYKMVNYKQNSD